jgi:PAS domain S-box-containing protein
MNDQQSNDNKSLEENIAKLLPLFEKIKAGNFSETIQIPQSQGEITKVYEGVQNLLTTLREKDKELRTEKESFQQTREVFYRQAQDLKALVDDSPDIIARFDRDLRYISINPTIEKFTGIAPGSFIGKTNKELSMPEAQEHFLTEHINKVFETGQESRIEYWFRAPDQQIRHFQARLVPERAQDGAVQYVLSVSHDITELKKRTEELDKERVKDQAILANIGDGLIVTDNMGRIILMNQVAQDLLGWSTKEAAGRVLTEIIPLEDEKQNPILPDNRPVFLALHSNKKISAKFYYRRRDRTKFPVAMTVTPLVISSGIVGAIEVFRDITREKELDHVKDQFLSLVSHELRTPMTAIKGLISMALKGDYGELPERLKQPLSNVYTSAERQLRLINDLLNISRFQAGRIKYTLLNFSLAKVTEEVVASFQAQANIKKITLTVAPKQEIIVQGDDIWIKEVLSNLISNATKFTNSGSVDLSYRIDNDQAMVVVTDTGLGIPLAEQEKLFGKFEQIITPAQGKAVGSGLGLYISRGVARKMGGDVVLEKSVPGQGSTFVFSIPKAGSQRALAIKTELEKARELALNR